MTAEVLENTGSAGKHRLGTDDLLHSKLYLRNNNYLNEKKIYLRNSIMFI